MATGICNCASTLGTAIAAPLLTMLMLAFGWRWMFMIMGIAGLLVALIWYVLYRDPAEVDPDHGGGRLPHRGRHHRPDGAGHLPASGGRCSRCRTTWGMILGFFGTHLHHLDL